MANLTDAIKTNYCPFNFKSVGDCVKANKFKVCICSQIAEYYMNNKTLIK
uniref:Uncharacterized protein n=1 Tax=Geladintestivirus 1 TaxID=3233133 RepID=A0AAU8MHU4_9CAUD